MAKDKTEELEQRIAELEDANDTANGLLQTKDVEIENLTSKLEAAEKGLAQAQELIAQQSKKIADLENATPGANATDKAAEFETKTSVDVKGKKYYFRKETFVMVGDPKKHQATEAATDNALIERILAINGQTILIEAE